MVKKLIFGAVIALLLFVSLFPRSIDVLNSNPIFDIDQGRDYMAVKQIVVDHKPTLIGAELGAGQAGLQYLFHGPGYFYAHTIPFILFGGNPVGGVALMLLFGLSAIAFGTYLVGKLLGREEGIIMGFLIALCPFFIGQSRFFENHFPSTFFILLVFYFVYRFTKNPKDSKFIFLAALASAGIYNFEFADAVPLCITLLIYLVILFKRNVISRLPYLAAGYILGFLPMILFEARHGFMGTKSLLTYIFVYQPPHASSPTIAVHAKNIFNLFVYSFSDSFPGRLVFPVSIILIGFIALVWFAYSHEKDRVKKHFITYILLLFPVNFAVFLLLRNIVFQHYIIDLFLANLLLFTYGLSSLYKNGYFKPAATVFAYFIFLVAVGTYSAYKVSVYDYSDPGGVHKLKAKIDAIDYIYKDAAGKPFGLLVFSPPVYTYPYDYLAWWRGQKEYGYTPHSEKKGTFYLLIEKDSEKPWSYIGWQQTVIKTGKVVFTKTLPGSGFIVEKRIAE